MGLFTWIMLHEKELRKCLYSLSKLALSCFFSPPPQAEVLSRNQRYLWGGADWESGSLGFCRGFTEVILQLFEVSHFPCGCTVCAGTAHVCALKDISKRLYRAQRFEQRHRGHSQQNICKLYPRLDFDKHIILHIFQFITILSKWQLCRGSNLCWVVCFCKSDIFIPSLMGIIWGRKNSLTSDGALKGYCGGKRSMRVLHALNVDKWTQNMSNDFICIRLKVTVVFIP